MARSVRVSRRFDAPAERVFDAWIDPAVAARWLFKTPTGSNLRAEIDARPGGRFRIVETRPDVGEAEHLGTYEVVDRPRKLVFTVGSPQYPGPVTRVIMEIATVGVGCELTLTQEDLPDDWVEALTVGWSEVLESLGEAVHET